MPSPPHLVQRLVRVLLEDDEEEEEEDEDEEDEDDEEDELPEEEDVLPAVAAAVSTVKCFNNAKSLNLLLKMMMDTSEQRF